MLDVFGGEMVVTPEQLAAYKRDAEGLETRLTERYPMVVWSVLRVPEFNEVGDWTAKELGLLKVIARMEVYGEGIMCMFAVSTDFVSDTAVDPWHYIAEKVTDSMVSAILDRRNAPERVDRYRKRIEGKHD